MKGLFLRPPEYFMTFFPPGGRGKVGKWTSFNILDEGGGRENSGSCRNY